MIKKIINKIKTKGFNGTIFLILERIKQKFYIKYNFTVFKKNYLKREWNHYWKSYNFILKKYRKKLLKMPLINGTGEYSNKVWWCWLQGEENAPPLQKQCLKSLKRHLKDRDIIVITSENLYNYIDLPGFIRNKYEKGIISNTHFSDLVRLQLLIKYGGTWIDSTAYCTGYDKDLFDKPLFVYKNCNYIWYANKNKFNQESIVADNWFITSEIGNPILITVRDLLFDYWEHNNYLIDYFIFHYFFTMTVIYKYFKQFNDIPIVSHLLPHILQYECLNKYDKDKFMKISRQSSFHKLTHKIDEDKIKKDSFLSYIISGKCEK